MGLAGSTLLNYVLQNVVPAFGGTGLNDSDGW
jgi:hypothetical protein